MNVHRISVRLHEGPSGGQSIELSRGHEQKKTWVTLKRSFVKYFSTLSVRLHEGPSGGQFIERSQGRSSYDERSSSDEQSIGQSVSLKVLLLCPTDTRRSLKEAVKVLSLSKGWRYK